MSRCACRECFISFLVESTARRQQRRRGSMSSLSSSDSISLSSQSRTPSPPFELLTQSRRRKASLAHLAYSREQLLLQHPQQRVALYAAPSFCSIAPEASALPPPMLTQKLPPGLPLCRPFSTSIF